MTPRRTTPRYRALSLFTGAGGFDVGIEMSRQFELLACVEHQPVFCETLRRNRDAGRLLNRKMTVVEEDIRVVDPVDLMSQHGLAAGELDLLVGGPPCQAFSTAGRRQSIRDPRGELLWEFLRFIVALRPRFFVMENVRGLLSAALHHRVIARRPEKGGPPLAPDEEPGSVVRLWVDDLLEATGGEYRVDCFEVNAVNYGAPQLRERAIFVGNREGMLVDFPTPTHGPIDPSDRQAGMFDGLLPFRTLRDAIGEIREAEPTLMDFSARKKGYLAMVPPGSNWRSLPLEVQKESMGRAWFAKGGRSGWWRRLSWDLPSPTVVTMPNHASTAMCHPDEVRVLSLRECAAIQEFPKGWEFCGTTQQQYEQVGNAVPTRLGEVTGETVAKYLHLANADADPKAGATDPRVAGMFAPAFRKVYLRSHVRTRQWYRDGEVFVWTDGGENGHAQYSARRRPSLNT